MKFYTRDKENSEYYKKKIKGIYRKDGFITLGEVKDLFREDATNEDRQIVWDEDSKLDKKIRSRECKDGWYLYLPEPNAKLWVDKKDNENFKAVANIEPNIDVCVFETEIFEKLVKALENNRLSIETLADRIIERWMHYEADVYTGFEKLGDVVGGHYGYFYRPCIVKAKKSGRKEERQDRNAKFHRWADLSKGVQQVVAIVEFSDGHVEQVQPDRVVFEEVEEND